MYLQKNIYLSFSVSVCGHFIFLLKKTFGKTVQKTLLVFCNVWGAKKIMFSKKNILFCSIVCFFLLSLSMYVSILYDKKRVIQSLIRIDNVHNKWFFSFFENKIIGNWCLCLLFGVCVSVSLYLHMYIQMINNCRQKKIRWKKFEIFFRKKKKCSCFGAFLWWCILFFSLYMIIIYDDDDNDNGFKTKRKK